MRHCQMATFLAFQNPVHHCCCGPCNKRFQVTQCVHSISINVLLIRSNFSACVFLSNKKKTLIWFVKTPNRKLEVHYTQYMYICNSIWKRHIKLRVYLMISIFLTSLTKMHITYKHMVSPWYHSPTLRRFLNCYWNISDKSIFLLR